MKHVLLIVAIVTACYSMPAADQLPVDPAANKELVTYLKTHYASPEDYVLSKFKDHDVVILGEWHRIKHDPELIQALIPRLHKNGICLLAMEFARREDQPLIDRLIKAPEYDEQLARQIQFNQFVFWGYREYVDIYKAAWQLNKTLPRGARQFRILGINSSLDWSVIKTEADAANPSIRRQVFKDGGEDTWAKVILDQVGKNEKLLVYCGLHHAFSEYRQPIYDERNKKLVRLADDRMGNYLYRAIGKRVITVSLHAPWIPAEGFNAGYYVRAADGRIDAVLAEVEPRFRRAGFDTRGTPFGQLPGGTSLYMYGYENFKLADLCDGYIIQKPLGEYEGVTPIPDFINAMNVEHARAQSPNPRLRDFTIERFNAAIAADADVKKRVRASR